MAQFNVLQHAMNVGVVDKDKLHRVDLERMRLAAEEQTNWMVDSVGRMFLRPGSTYISTVPAGSKARLMPFIAGESAAYLLELSNNNLRVFFEDRPLARPGVLAVIQNGDFATAGAGWTLGDTAGADASMSDMLWLSVWARGAIATASQEVMTSSPTIQHSVRVVIERGPVTLRIGSALGLDDYLTASPLDVGTHSLAFVPAGDFFIQFESRSTHIVAVRSIHIEPAGVVSLPTLWPASSLRSIRTAQSLDVLYCAARGFQPQKIERRGTGAVAGQSWSVVRYQPDDGPFLGAPSSLAKLRPDKLEGDTALHSDIPFFKPGHVGALFRLYHDGQNVDTWLMGESQFTPPIMVTGINEPEQNDRFFVYTIAGTWVGTLRNQRSFDGDDVNFHDYRDKQTSSVVDITANVASATNDDNADNAICYYRIGFPPDKYTSGAAHVTVSYNGGGGVGIGRVTEYVSPTEVKIQVLEPFKNTTSTDSWLEGSWSDVQGYPNAVELDDGRLHWPGDDKYWASVSDGYQSFDISMVGEAAPIDRAIALGGRNESRWAMSLSVMILGTDSRIAKAAASALEETITPDNMTIRNVGQVGAAAVEPAKLKENSGVFVEASMQAVYAIDFVEGRGAYVVTEFSKLSNGVFKKGVTELVVSQRPDQRVHACIDNGDAVTVVYEPQQEVTAFIPISTSSPTDFIESQCVLTSNGEPQERVYRSVLRVVNGQPNRFIERVAGDDEAVPRDVCKVMDAGVLVPPGVAVVQVPHLIGRTVVAWVDGAPVLDPAITDGRDDDAMKWVVPPDGQITLPETPLKGGFVGLPYVARYKSGRLAYGVGQSSPVLQMMSLVSVGLMLSDFVRSGLRYGVEFDNPYHPLSSLPIIGPNGMPAPDICIGPGPDEFPLTIESGLTLDSRLCIEARSPKPVTVLAMLLGISRG